MAAELWYVDEEDVADDVVVREYDITATPNDFNVRTICDFIESGLVKIPGFQRNYVWDIKRASKLIESLIIGLPIPQVFLYEEARNSFLVIDGQQRLMSLYYFRKGRFPRMEQRPALRRIFDEHGGIPKHMLTDDRLFTDFNLQLPSPLPNQPNKFNRLSFDTLDDYQPTLDLRTIRNVVIRQSAPEGDDSSIYEIFNRLNSGGVNLTPQEIRVSLYHSEFYSMLDRINLRPRWRELLGLREPDLHTKDLEILLRAFSMLVFSAEYKPSMTKFLNASSRRFKSFNKEAIDYCEQLFDSFLAACGELDHRAFFGRQTRRFNISIFEAVFLAACQSPFQAKAFVAAHIDAGRLERLTTDVEFVESTQKNTVSTENVALRRKKASQVLFSPI